MTPQTRQMARRQLDKRIESLPNFRQLKPPPKGWIKAIREAIGMTARQLAARIGIAQPTLTYLENAEAKGSITLDSLRRAANALDCDLAYVLIPRRGLNELVEAQSIKAAQQKLKSTKHTMALEKQSIDKDDEQEQIIRIAKSLAEKSDSRIWEVK